MLISSRMEHHPFFSGLQALVVDEIHAFAGDDRGWHLLAVMERISECAGRDIQRIGCSATVGNPEDLVSWLAGNSKKGRAVISPPAQAEKTPDVQLDYVGSLENAAIVISRLHRGEKRLVFCDSRARVEKLGNLLRRHSIETYVSHSSLSAEERRRAELAFSESRNCVIVATSALELGIDVGDLDRVIQIDAPATVSSFLQRMGRTGRRQGSSRNCLFLATKEPMLIQAAALLSLWHSGFVEPVQPPQAPYHLLAQQILAMLLERRSCDRATLLGKLTQTPPFRSMCREAVESVLDFMLTTDVLAQDQGILWFGLEGEKRYGFRNFIKLSSIFDTPPMFSVRSGSADLGFVDEITFQRGMEEQVLLLSGRSWLVRSVDWKRRIVQVEPTDMQGKSNWAGSGPVLSYEMCTAIREQLAGDKVPDFWSKRAKEGMEGLRHEMSWVGNGELLLIDRGNQCELWTFAGMVVNNTLALILQAVLGVASRPENLKITIDTADLDQVARWIREYPTEQGLSQLIHKQIESLQWETPKFCESLPPQILAEFYISRYTNQSCAEALVQVPVRRFKL